MKRLLFLIGLTGSLILTSCTATKILVNFPEPIVKVYEVNSSKDLLFINANRWMVSVFKDAKSVIQYSDKTEGVLMGKYLLNYNSYSMQYVYAIIEIKVKDRKARISVTPDNWTYSQYNYGIPHWTGTENSTFYTKERAISDIDILCDSFNKGLQASDNKF
jgi:hypothetical protein